MTKHRDSLWWLPWTAFIALVAVLMTFASCSTTHRHVRRALPHETPEQSKSALKQEINNCTHKSHKK